jgi:cytochrome P450
MVNSTETATPGCPAHGIARISRMDDVIAAVRSKEVLKSPESWAGLIEAGNEHEPSLQAAADDLLRGTVSFVDGDDFRKRRRLLNSLMRPEALEHIREHVVLPAARRIIWDAANQPLADGTHRCELVGVLERIFLESSAKIIGLVDVESDERMARLRECVFPLFALFQTKFFEDRATIVEEGREAKRIFVEEFYRPAYEATKRALADLADGEELPPNLMRLIVTGTDKSWTDEEIAIRDSILIFVATVGTSAQTVISTIHDLGIWFEKNPDKQHLAFDMGFLTDAFEESIRLRSPFISYITREAIDDFVLPSGIEVHKGQQVYIQLPKTNRQADLFGDDPLEFNPLREIAEGQYRYGLGFSTGPHQCLGLRMVLGNDGRGGSHIKLLRMLLKLGVRGDEENAPEILQMKEEEDAQADIPTYITYPAIFTRWENFDTAMEAGVK